MMAKSSARKKRERMVKKGQLDPAMLRGSWGMVKPVTRVKPNKSKYDYKDYEPYRSCELYSWYGLGS